jgi:hypothetical protein
MPWHGRPAEPPRAASDGKALWASWNGATEVAAWRLLAGPSADALAARGTEPRRGFETPLHLPAGARFAAAVALDAGGNELARSAPVSV